MRNASEEDKRGFAESDIKEWQSVRGMNAVNTPGRLPASFVENMLVAS